VNTVRNILREIPSGAKPCSGQTARESSAANKPRKLTRRRIMCALSQTFRVRSAARELVRHDQLSAPVGAGRRPAPSIYAGDFPALTSSSDFTRTALPFTVTHDFTVRVKIGIEFSDVSPSKRGDKIASASGIDSIAL